MIVENRERPGRHGRFEQNLSRRIPERRMLTSVMQMLNAESPRGINI